ncbi:hypothetical protein Cgig2_017248 [Carnegiea gigantea]|uniref:Uncharacterized protein n=1 Tax=Carnegiea gigantea TaxID=171969 RepID=A0A9Q1GTM4_9CARY|nr:hypothetical protein Cgig2_017248 [Carnegiea gigantea]
MGSCQAQTICFAVSSPPPTSPCWTTTDVRLESKPGASRLASPSDAPPTPMRSDFRVQWLLMRQVNLIMSFAHDLAVTVTCPHPRRPLLTQCSDAHFGGEKNALPSYEKFDELIDKIDARKGVEAKFFHKLLAWSQRDGEKLLGGGPLVIVQEPIDNGKPFALGQVRMHVQLLSKT